MSVPVCVCMSVRVCLTWVPVLVQLVHVLSLCDPVHVTTQVLLHLLLLPQLLEVSSGLGLFSLLAELSAVAPTAESWSVFFVFLHKSEVLCLNVEVFGLHQPAEDTKNQVENEEGAKDHQADKVNPGQLETDGIIHLGKEEELSRRKASRKMRKRRGRKGMEEEKDLEQEEEEK